VDEKDSTPFSQSAPSGWARQAVADKCEQFERLHSPWTSQRQIAQQLGVPRSTLQDWLRKKQQCREQSALPDPVTEFFESPDGLDFLHRLLTALHLVFGQAGGGGIRNTCMFLQLSGLGQFAAASYGAQQAAAEEVEQAIVQFGQEEDQRLAAAMPPQDISLAEDETFHPQCCLVGIEPVSNFILLEQYADRRDAETWQRCLNQRLEGLPVHVLQVTSDHAKALIRHAEICLGAHHSPDLFHVQHETVKATGFALANQQERAQKALEKAREQRQTQRALLQACSEDCPQTGELDELQRVLTAAEAAVTAAEQHLQTCQDRRQQATEARQGLSEVYHPFDLNTAAPQTGETVERRLTEHFDQLDAVAESASLSQGARDRLAKARRALPRMQATLAFFWATVSVWLERWQLPSAVCELMREALIPVCYLRLAAGKASTAEPRKRLLALADEIEARARSPDSVWWSLDEEAQQKLATQAERCAELFQRSSSCVEGRNGHLALKHHALHRLTARKLSVLTVLHNYLVSRDDHTTAAERFYGQRPRDIFPWLLARVSYPSRPRRYEE